MWKKRRTILLILSFMLTLFSLAACANYGDLQIDDALGQKYKDAGFQILTYITDESKVDSTSKEQGAVAMFSAETYTESISIIRYKSGRAAGDAEKQIRNAISASVSAGAEQTRFYRRYGNVIAFGTNKAILLLDGDL